MTRHSSAVAVAVALLLVTTNARAQTASQEYKACYAADRTGSVYRIDDPAYPAPGAFPASTKTASGCATAKDRSFLWNAVGPVGPQGPTGDVGPTGDAGPQGPAGP